MHVSVKDVFYSLHFHQHVSAAIAAIFRVMLLQEYKSRNVVGCVGSIAFKRYYNFIKIYKKVTVKQSHYMPGEAQRIQGSYVSQIS